MRLSKKARYLLMIFHASSGIPFAASTWKEQSTLQCRGLIHPNDDILNSFRGFRITPKGVAVDLQKPYRKRGKRCPWAHSRRNPRRLPKNEVRLDKYRYTYSIDKAALAARTEAEKKQRILPPIRITMHGFE